MLSQDVVGRGDTSRQMTQNWFLQANKLSLQMQPQQKKWLENRAWQQNEDAVKFFR